MTATALVSAGALLAPSVQAEVYRYTANGTYSGPVTLTSGEYSEISAASGVTATYAGAVNYTTGVGLSLGQPGADNGLLIFSPTSIAADPSSFVHVSIRGGTVRFGNDVARSFFSEANRSIHISGGTFDLFGTSQSVMAIFDGSSTDGRIINDASDTLAVLTVKGGDYAGTLADGAGLLRLRKEGEFDLGLAGNNTYSGGTDLAEGTLTVASSGALGTGLLHFTADGFNPLATFSLEGTGLNLANDIDFAGTAGGIITVAGDTNLNTLSGDISGWGSLFKRGAGTLVLAGENTSTGTVFIDEGTLIARGPLANGAIGDQAAVRVADNSLLIVERTETIGSLTGAGDVAIAAGQIFRVGENDASSGFTGTISGSGRLDKAGAGSFQLFSTNTYTLGTFLEQGEILAGATGALGTGAVTIGAPDTNLLLMGGVTLDNTFLLDNGDLNVEVEADATAMLGGSIREIDPLAGNLGLVKRGEGTLVLTGNSAEAQFARVEEGRLRLDGSFGGDVTVLQQAMLEGIGAVGGNVFVENGGTLRGRSDQVLTMGTLTLSEIAGVDVLLGAPGGSAIFNVEGDLTLDGQLNIYNTGGFGLGVYRLFDYGGNLVDGGMEIAAVPVGYSGDEMQIQTTIANQVNLVVGDTGPMPEVQFWDGSDTTADGNVDGGSGTWRAGSSNWTNPNGEINGAWGGRFAIFQGEVGGVVAVDGEGGPMAVTGMQFAVDGYRIQGDAISLAAPQTVIRVGDGSGGVWDHIAVIDSELTGPGSLVKDDSGVLFLRAANSYQGDTFVRNGVLVGTADSIRNNLINNGEVILQAQEDGVFSGSITGTGVMTKGAGGTLTLTGASTLDWEVENGRLVARTSLFTGDVSIDDGAYMRFEQQASGTYGGIISGDGILELSSGAGNLIALAGDSSGFEGSTAIVSGGLRIDGKLGGTLDMLSGTLLGGTGTVGATVVRGGATVAPGNSIGTLTIDGDFTQEAGSTYRVEINPEGQSDMIDVTGTANLLGGTVAVERLAGTYDRTIRYTILSADGGLTGTYAALDHDMPFLNVALGYDASNVYLDIDRNSVAFCDVVETRNQCAVADGAQSLGAGNAVYDALAALPNAASAAAAFDRLSGEMHASAKTMLIEDTRFVREAALNRLRVAFDGTAQQQTSGALSFWARGFGSWGDWDGNGNAARFDRDIGGFSIGGDAPMGDSLRIGLLGGYQSASIDAEERSSSGSVDSWNIGAYAGGQWGAFALSAGAAYGHHRIESERNVAFTGFSENLSASYDAHTVQAFGEAAYSADVGPVRFEPFANLAYVNLHTDGFTENGGAAALSAGSHSMDATFTTIGLRAETALTLWEAGARLHGSVGWRHSLGDRPDAGLRFASGGDGFTVAGVPVAEDTFVFNAGLEMNLTPNAMLGFSYGGQFGSGITDQNLKANLSARF